MDILPLDPTTMRHEGFLNPKNLGERTPKNDGFTWVCMLRWYGKIYLGNNLALFLGPLGVYWEFTVI